MYIHRWACFNRLNEDPVLACAHVGMAQLPANTTARHSSLNTAQTLRCSGIACGAHAHSRKSNIG